MNNLEKLEICDRLRKAKRSEIYSDTLTGENGNGFIDVIIWDDLSDEPIPYVIIDKDEIELDAELAGLGMEWFDDESFLRDQFFKNLDWLRLLPQ